MKKTYNRDIQRKFQQRTKEEALAHYGGQCKNCGERITEILNLVWNGSKVKIKGNSQLGYRLKRKNYPDGWIVLCHNCKELLKVEKKEPPILDGSETNH